MRTTSPFVIPSRPKRFRVALAVPQGLAFLERVLHGVADYARAHGAWTFTRLPETLGTSTAWLRQWSGDGALVLAVTNEDGRQARRLPFPVVNLASHSAGTGLTTVVVDHARIGELAALHLIERRFERFAYYGPSGLWYSQLRRNGFQRAVLRAGGSCKVFERKFGLSAGHGWRDQSRGLQAWLRTLNPPVGILASTDLRAGMILEACCAVGLRVPQDIALVGVDNDPVVAEFSEPPLTSVSRNDYEVGRKAAEVLAALMRSKLRRYRAQASRVYFVPPDGVVQRGSTETVAIDDPLIKRAVDYIREHTGESMRIPILLRHVPLSRRAFEYRFRAAMGTSPGAYISRARIEAAKATLSANPRAKISAVAAACGFSSPRRLRVAFDRSCGITPSQFRRESGTQRKS